MFCLQHLRLCDVNSVKLASSSSFFFLNNGLWYVILFIHKLWPTPLPTNTVTPNPLYTSLPAPMYIIYAHYLFRLLFLSIISTAYHLLSGFRGARLPLN